MQQILDVRIVRWYFKLIYVVGAWLAGFPVLALLHMLGAPALVASLVENVVTLGSILLGARLFRGRGEPVAPRRPWWKMTARPLLSRVLGVVALVGTLVIVIVIVSAALGFERSVVSLQRQTITETVIAGIFTALFVFLYLNSAARIGAVPARVREPKFKPRVRLK